MGFVFVAGSPALDFCGTLGERGTSHVERLVVPDDLRSWIRESELVDEFGAPISGADVIAARRLREAIYAVVVAIMAGERPGRRALATVNAAAADPPIALHVTPGRLLRTGDLPAVLSTVARSALDLFGPADDAVLRMCADSKCTHPFLDRSHGHRRRWCGMDACGNRAKAAAFRARHPRG